MSSCSNNRKKSTTKETDQKPIISKISQIDNDSKIENEVISQIIQSVIDSLNNRIKVDLGKDYKNYKIINIADTLHDFGYYGGMKVDSIDFQEKSNSKLEVINTKLKWGKELRFVSSFEEYAKLTYQDNVNRMLMFFSRAHFNKTHDECLLTVGLSSHINAGEDYAIYAKKENDKWILKRILVSAIR